MVVEISSLNVATGREPEARCRLPGGTQLPSSTRSGQFGGARRSWGWLSLRRCFERPIRIQRAKPDRNLSSYRDLSSAGHSAIARSRLAARDERTDPGRRLLNVRQLEVVYHDVATAIQGVSIEVALGSMTCHDRRRPKARLPPCARSRGSFRRRMSLLPTVILSPGSRFAAFFPIKSRGWAWYWCPSARSCFTHSPSAKISISV